MLRHVHALHECCCSFEIFPNTKLVRQVSALPIVCRAPTTPPPPCQSWGGARPLNVDFTHRFTCGSSLNNGQPHPLHLAQLAFTHIFYATSKVE